MRRQPFAARRSRPRIVPTTVGFQCVPGVSLALMTAVLARVGVLGGLAPGAPSARRRAAAAAACDFADVRFA